MTRILEEAFKRASELPEERQNVIGRMLLEVVADDARLPRLTAEQEEQVKASVQEADAGRFASSEVVNAVYKKHGA